MTNAKEEFLVHTEYVKNFPNGNRNIKCASIQVGDDWSHSENNTRIVLRVNYTPQEFLTKLDFKYDSGYGGQELFGTIWYDDDITFSDRGEYDGSEWWDYHYVPVIPKECL